MWDYIPIKIELSFKHINETMNLNLIIIMETRMYDNVLHLPFAKYVSVQRY